MTDVSERDQSVNLFGQTFRSPLILAPTGLPGVLWPDGAAKAARAADAAGVGFCLSTMSTSSIEDVAKVSRQRTWFQVYVMRDRELTRSMMQAGERRGLLGPGHHRGSTDAGTARPRRAQRPHHAPVCAWPACSSSGCIPAGCGVMRPVRSPHWRTSSLPAKVRTW